MRKIDLNLLDTTIMVVKSAEDRNRRDAAYVLDGAMDRSVFAKQAASSVLGTAYTGHREP